MPVFAIPTLCGTALLAPLASCRPLCPWTDCAVNCADSRPPPLNSRRSVTTLAKRHQRLRSASRTESRQLRWVLAGAGLPLQLCSHAWRRGVTQLPQGCPNGSVCSSVRCFLLHSMHLTYN